VTFAEWAVLAAVLLYLLTLAPIKPLGHRDFDNADPRSEAFYAPPLRKRVLGAHLNGVETFPFFAFAVLLAEFRACPQAWIDGLAWAFIALRLAFVAAYVGDRPWTRTAIWNLGFAVNVAIFLLPLAKR
jgi:uncharacterized MAPEG superfamily protein